MNKSKHLVVLYGGDDGVDIEAPFDYHWISKHPITRTFKDSRSYPLWKAMIREKVLNRVTVIYETDKQCGQLEIAPHIFIVCVPTIDRLRPFFRGRGLPHDNVIFLVHGIRHTWIDFLEKRKKFNKWIVGVSAGGQIYDDSDIALYHRGPMPSPWGLAIPFTFPVNEKVFHPNGHAARNQIDIFIGSQDPQDAVSLIMQYKRTYGSYPVCVMPGRIEDSNVLRWLQDPGLSVAISTPGCLSDTKIRNLLKRSTLYLNTGRKLDPGTPRPEDAAAAGCSMLLSDRIAPHWFSSVGPSVYYNTVNSLDSIPTTLQTMRTMLHVRKDNRHSQAFQIYRQYNGLDEVVIPATAKSLNALMSHPRSDRAWSEEVFNA